MSFSKKCFITQSLSLCIFRTRTVKHKNLPFFCMIAEDNMFKKLRQLYEILPFFEENHNIEWRCGV